MAKNQFETLQKYNPHSVKFLLSERDRLVTSILRHLTKLQSELGVDGHKAVVRFEKRMHKSMRRAGRDGFDTIVREHIFSVFRALTTSFDLDDADYSDDPEYPLNYGEQGDDDDLSA